MATLALPAPRRLRSPLALTLLVYAGNAVVIVAGALVAAAVLPDADGLTRSLVASVGSLLFTIVVARAVAVRNGGWSGLGLTRPREWRDTRLLVVPALITLVPLLGGVRSIEGGTWAVLLTGYVMTGFMEELLWRGTVQRILAPIGTARAVWLGSAIFGAAHLTNVLFRPSVGLVLSQAFGAFCFGVGYAALRWRTNTIWPLMAMHLATDLFAAVGGLPKIPVLVAQDVVLLALGAYLIRKGARDRMGASATH
jgi:membrane protease YdiL (CAAX protease family)